MLQLFRTLNLERALTAERPRMVRTQGFFCRSVSGPSNPFSASCGGLGVFFSSQAPACFIPQVGGDIREHPQVHRPEYGVCVP